MTLIIHTQILDVARGIKNPAEPKTYQLLLSSPRVQEDNYNIQQK